MSRNETRTNRFDVVVASYGEPCCLAENLTDLLTDAMHWSDSSNLDFHIAFAQACRHYLHELNNQQTNERRLP